MGDLVEWLRAQLDEDERIARATDKTLGQGHLRWGAQPVDDAFSRVLTGRGWVVGTGEFKPEDAEYIAEWDPERVLREIDAKRRTLIRCEEAMLSASPMLVHFAKQTAWEMARPYTDRPGYREERWKP